MAGRIKKNPVIDIGIPFKVVNVTKSLISSRVPMALVLNVTIQILSLWDFIMTDVTALLMPSIMKKTDLVHAKMVTFNLELHASWVTLLLVQTAKY